MLVSVMAGCGTTAPTPAPISLVGQWRVTGCETNPMDPADCGRVQLTFTTDHVTIDVPAAEQMLSDNYITPTMGR